MLETRLFGKALYRLCSFLVTALLSSFQAGAQTGQITENSQARSQTHDATWDSLPSWFRFDTELRGRLEGETGIDNLKGNDDAYFLSRFRAGFRFLPSRFVDVYVQVQDTHVPGLPVRFAKGNMRDAFDFREAYVSFHRSYFRFTAGRQELLFGSERIIGISDFTNNSRTFDGFDLRIGDRNRVDIFSTSVTSVHPTSLDTHGPGLHYHGAYGRLNALAPRTSIQPFVLIRTAKHVVDGYGIAGSEWRTTFGAEVTGELPRGFEYGVIGALQGGSFASQSVRAGAGVVKVSRRLTRRFWKPRLIAEADYASGGNAARDGYVRTYDQQYPSNHNVFGQVDLFGFQNIRQVRASLEVKPGPNTTILAQGGTLSVASEHAPIYSGSGGVLFPPSASGFSSRDLGREIDLSARYVWREGLTVNLGMGHLFAAGSAPVRSTTLAYLSLTYRLKVSR